MIQISERQETRINQETYSFRNYIDDQRNTRFFDENSQHSKAHTPKWISHQGTEYNYETGDYKLFPRSILGYCEQAAFQVNRQPLLQSWHRTVPAICVRQRNVFIAVLAATRGDGAARVNE